MDFREKRVFPGFLGSGGWLAVEFGGWPAGWAGRLVALLGGIFALVALKRGQGTVRL